MSVQFPTLEYHPLVAGSRSLGGLPADGAIVSPENEDVKGDLPDFTEKIDPSGSQGFRSGPVGYSVGHWRPVWSRV